MCYSGGRKMIPERNRNSGNNKDHNKDVDKPQREFTVMTMCSEVYVYN